MDGVQKRSHLHGSSKIKIFSWFWSKNTWKDDYAYLFSFWIFYNHSNTILIKNKQKKKIIPHPTHSTPPTPFSLSHHKTHLHHSDFQKNGISPLPSDEDLNQIHTLSFSLSLLISLPLSLTHSISLSLSLYYSLSLPYSYTYRQGWTRWRSWN